MYTSFADIVRICEEEKCSAHELFLRSECKLSGCAEKDVYDKMDARLTIMEDSATRALHRALPSAGGMLDGLAARQMAYAEAAGSLCGGFLNRVMAMALSCSEVNASMGRICAAPTAGSCGILPAVILSVGQERGLPRKAMLDALLTASGFGAVVMRNATVAGAEGGCQAECGVAAAMAAAAAVQLLGGNLAQMLSAFSHALIHCMGLVCDPIAGLVQVPCAQRNASQAVNALLSADMALAGQVFMIPADEVVEAMYKVGRQLPIELKETAQGGIAATRTAKKVTKDLRNSSGR